MPENDAPAIVQINGVTRGMASEHSKHRFWAVTGLTAFRVGRPKQTGW